MKNKLADNLRKFISVAVGALLVLSLLASAILIPTTPAYAATAIYTTPGAYPWTVPSGVSSITVEVWGGGGKGATMTINGGGGGGGGGAYSRVNISVTAGDAYYVTVGAGATTTAAGSNSSFNRSGIVYVLAVGGNSVADNNSTGASGGAASSGTGDVKYSGGNGANGSGTTYGGGGGSSAGNASDGTTATNQSGATAPAGGGKGGNGATSQGNGAAGSQPGGGGGGALRTSGGTRTGGSGAAGKVVITYKYDTSTTLTSSLNPSKYGQSVKFTATVNNTSATGTIRFYDGAILLGSNSSLVSGNATLTIGNLSVSTHSITASYSGDANHGASTSSALSQTVNKADTSTALASSLNPSRYSQPVTFTATVNNTSATGTIQFYDGAILLGSNSSLVGGKATLSVSTLNVSGSPHSITASYSGDTNYSASTSSALLQTANKTNTSTALASSANPSTYGQTITFTATINISAATGTVQFYDRAILLGSNNSPVGGIATLAVSTLNVSGSPHSITARYLGDSNCNASNSSALSQTVTKGNTTTTVVSSANPSTYGQSITFTATINISTATGTVQFNIDSKPFGSPVAVSGGIATSNAISSLSAGNHPVTANYSGDSNCSASNGTLAGGQTVGTAIPSITWSNPTNITYGTALSGTQLNAFASVPGTFAYTPPSGTVLNTGDNQTLHVDFTPTDIANYSTASKDVYINVTKATPTITWSNPANITYGIALSSTQLNASASVSGSFVYTPPEGTVLSAGNSQTLHVDFTPTDTNNYSTASKDVYINVTKVTSTITWSNPANITYGTPLSSTQLNASASVSGSFVYTPPEGTVLSAGSSQTLHVDFTPTDATNYSTAATNVHINVTKVTPTITWANPADIVYGTSLDATQLNATASVPGAFVYNPGTGTVLNVGEGQNLRVDFTPTDTANYTNASKNVSINVKPVPRTIDITAPTDITDWSLNIGSNTKSGPLTVTVSPYGANWSVRAYDANSTTAGYMTGWNGTAWIKLTYPMNVSGNYGTVSLSTGGNISKGSGNFSDNVTFTQGVTWNDEPATYQIVVTFIGTVY